MRSNSLSASEFKRTGVAFFSAPSEFVFNNYILPVWLLAGSLIKVSASVCGGTNRAPRNYVFDCVGIKFLTPRN